MVDEVREQELKFEVPDGWSVPDLSALGGAGARVEINRLELHTTYFDTDSHDLLRGHLTLRRRTGDADEGWQLKIPATKGARDELREPLDDGDEPPAALVDLVVGITRGARLRPIAILHTERTAHRVLNASATVLFETADDRVDATALGRPAKMTQWREAEIELLDGDGELLVQAARRVLKSGATASTSGSKLARAVGEPEAGRSGDSLHGVVGAFIGELCDTLVRADVDLRRERDVVHRARVATRRLRSVLRAFAQEVDETSARHLDAELGWYALHLGAVRDCQVLRARLLDSVAELPPELVLGPVAARITELLSTRERDARTALTRVRDGERYRTLLADLRAWRNDVPWAAPDRRGHDVEDYVIGAERLVNKRLKQARRAADPEHALHRARKAGKRARYVAELAEPVLGKRARALAKRLADLQDDLGDLQDGVIAAQFLQVAGAQAGVTPGENGFTFGILWAREQEAAQMAKRTAPKNLG